MKYRVIGSKVDGDGVVRGTDEMVFEAESEEQASALFYDTHGDTATVTWMIDEIREED